MDKRSKVAGKQEIAENYRLPSGLKFIDTASVKPLFTFPPDMAPVAVEANTLNNQVLVNTFEKEWANYLR
jgi:spermidine synthase